MWSWSYLNYEYRPTAFVIKSMSSKSSNQHSDIPVRFTGLQNLRRFIIIGSKFMCSWWASKLFRWLRCQCQLFQSYICKRTLYSGCRLYEQIGWHCNGTRQRKTKCHRIRPKNKKATDSFENNVNNNVVYYGQQSKHTIIENIKYKHILVSHSPLYNVLINVCVCVFGCVHCAVHPSDAGV